jgi:HlyD family secretion protein
VREHAVWIWFAIPLGVGIVAAVVSVARRGRIPSVYVGIVESDLATGTDHDSLHVRAYVDETLVHQLPVPSKLAGRMLIRETNTSVPLTFAGVPPYGSLQIERSDEWQARVEVPVLPVIFHFDPLPDLALRPGQLVDVYVEER